MIYRDYDIPEDYAIPPNYKGNAKHSAVFFIPLYCIKMSMSGIVPQEATFKVGGLPVSIDSVRRIVKMMPQNGTSGYEPNINGTIRIELPASLGFLDTHNSYLSFRVKTKGATVDHTKECRMDQNSMSWVRSMTITSSTGAQLEHIDHYNLLVNLLHKATSPDDYRLSIAKMLDGGGDRASRNAAMAHPSGSQYCSGFDCSGILGGATPYLPLAFCQGPITIELQLAAFSECFKGTAANGQTATYTVDNVEYHASCISFGQDYNMAFEKQLRQQGIDISYASYRTHNTTLIGSSHNIQISQNAKSVKGIYQVLRSKLKYQAAAYDSLTTYKSGNLEEVQWQLGGREFPEFPLKLKDDGVSNLYAHNLNSFNMFRNHSLGTSISEENFWSTELTATAAQGNYANGYKALPVRRVYGLWVASNASTASYPVQIGAGGLADKFNVETICFIPTNPKDLGLIEKGMRCKMGQAAQTAGEVSIAGCEPVKHADGSFKNINSNLGGALGVANAAPVGTIVAAGKGLDRFFDTNPAVTYTVVANRLFDHNYQEDSANVLYSGSPCLVRCGTQGVAGTPEKIAMGIGIPFVDGQNRPVFCRTAGFIHLAGWCDILPDDSSFFIGNSFETHHENSRLISGADLTNAVPLLCSLTYTEGTNGTDNFFEYRADGDPLTSFVHYDAVLRIEPDGTVISSN